MFYGGAYASTSHLAMPKRTPTRADVQFSVLRKVHLGEARFGSPSSKIAGSMQVRFNKNMSKESAVGKGPGTVDAEYCK